MPLRILLLSSLTQKPISVRLLQGYLCSLRVKQNVIPHLLMTGVFVDFEAYV